MHFQATSFLLLVSASSILAAPQAPVEPLVELLPPTELPPPVGIPGDDGLIIEPPILPPVCNVEILDPTAALQGPTCGVPFDPIITDPNNVGVDPFTFCLAATVACDSCLVAAEGLILFCGAFAPACAVCIPMGWPCACDIPIVDGIAQPQTVPAADLARMAAEVGPALEGVVVALENLQPVDPIVVDPIVVDPPIAPA